MVRQGRTKRSGTPFSRQLVAWMALAGLVDADLAKEVGVSTMAISRWRHGINAPTTDRWPALARALHIETAEIAKLLLNVDLLPPDVQAWVNDSPPYLCGKDSEY